MKGRAVCALASGFAPSGVRFWAPAFESLSA